MARKALLLLHRLVQILLAFKLRLNVRSREEKPVLACAVLVKESILMRKPPNPILIILAPILIAVATAPAIVMHKGISRAAGA